MHWLFAGLHSPLPEHVFWTAQVGPDQQLSHTHVPAGPHVPCAPQSTGVLHSSPSQQFWHWQALEPGLHTWFWYGHTTGWSHSAPVRHWTGGRHGDGGGSTTANTHPSHSSVSQLSQTSQSKFINSATIVKRLSIHVHRSLS